MLSPLRMSNRTWSKSTLVVIALGCTGCISNTRIQRLTLERIEGDKFHMLVEIEDDLAERGYTPQFEYVIKPIDQMIPSYVPKPGGSISLRPNVVSSPFPYFFDNPAYRFSTGFLGDESGGVVHMEPSQGRADLYRMILPLKGENDCHRATYDLKRGMSYVMYVRVTNVPRMCSFTTLDSNLLGVRIEMPP
jgi:hypothetical protein